MINDAESLQSGSNLRLNSNNNDTVFFTLNTLGGKY